MAELCLVASHGYPPGLIFHPAAERGIGRASKDYQTFLANPGLHQDLWQPCSCKSRLHNLKPSIGMLDSNEFFRTVLTTRRPVLIDVQDFDPNSLLFSFGIANQCTLREKILRFLMSRRSEVERGGVDLLLYDLMGPQALDTHQQPLLPYYGQSFLDAEPQPSLISLNSKFCFDKPLFSGDLGHGSEITYDTYYPDDGLSFTSSVTVMEDMLSALSELHLSKNSVKRKKQQMVVPYFDRQARRAARGNVAGSSPKLENLKSYEKVKYKASPKKKSNLKAVKERDFYRNNLFHACESLLSIMVDKKRHGRTAILSLRKSGPELPKVLTQFSASIAGTGLAVLFSVVCKVACARVPFCASKLLNTGLGIGLVWLSWAVIQLRDTIISINKNSNKLDVGEKEIMDMLDRSVQEMYFRATALMAVAVLRLA